MRRCYHSNRNLISHVRHSLASKVSVAHFLLLNNLNVTRDQLELGLI